MTKKFTLIELLIVIAIIGILVTLLLPSLAKAREAAKSAVCMSNLSQINKAAAMYLHDNNERFPGKIAGNGKHGWVGKKGSSITQAKLFPQNRPLNRYLGTFTMDEDEVKIAHCPSDKKYYNLRGSSYKNNTDMQWKSLHIGSKNGALYDDIQSPSRMVMMTEWGAIPTVKSNTGQILNFHVPFGKPNRYNTLFVEGHVKAVHYYTGQINSEQYVLERDR
jgi:prepilin-type N-terminal cleavage/methylation domain-containing protein